MDRDKMLQELSELYKLEKYLHNNLNGQAKYFELKCYIHDMQLDVYYHSDIEEQSNKAKEIKEQRQALKKVYKELIEMRIKYLLTVLKGE